MNPAPSPCVQTASGLPVRPKRADARRNDEKVLAAARAAFGERGAGTSLEEIARRAGVGIGTLYRHFPTRQALLEAVYVDEVEDLARTAESLSCASGGSPRAVAPRGLSDPQRAPGAPASTGS